MQAEPQHKIPRNAYCAAQQAFPQSSGEYVRAVTEEMRRCLSHGRCGELQSESEFPASLKCPKTGADVCRCNALHDFPK